MSKHLPPIEYLFQPIQCHFGASLTLSKLSFYVKDGMLIGFQDEKSITVVAVSK
jgi:hypothetical protein